MAQRRKLYDLDNHFRRTYGDFDDSWVLVEDGDMKGVALITDRDAGEVVCLSSRYKNDIDRWIQMPPLSGYASTLQVLDLHNSRYMEQLHESVGELSQLRRLVLTGCDMLTGLPASIGNLKNLIEVSLVMLLERTHSHARDSSTQCCSVSLPFFCLPD